MKDRFNDVFGADFTQSALWYESARDYAHVSGYVGLPTLHCRTSQHQHLFVMGPFSVNATSLFRARTYGYYVKG